eukprot:gene12302-8443_t
MEPYYTVRKATLEDVDTMVEMQLHMAMETERLQLDRETVRRGIMYPLSNPNVADYYVAECKAKNSADQEGETEPKKQIAAMLMTTFEWSEWRAGSIIWIQSVYVVPEHRRRGVFNLLYAHIKGIVETSEIYTGIRLYVEESNERAMATYNKVGMKEEHYRLMKWTKGGF